MRGLAVVLLVALPGIACVDRGVTPQRAATADTADQVMTGMTRGITRDGIRLTDVQAESAWVYNAADITRFLLLNAVNSDQISRTTFWREAQRRGLLDENEAKRQGKDASNIAEGFRISGLGQLIEMGIQTDRLVMFGD